MTGYGRGECAQAGFKVTVEANSVNRKQSEISVNLPASLEPLEARVRDEANRFIARGRLSLRVVLHAGEGRAPLGMLVNEPLARGYAEEFARLGARLKLSGPVTLETVLRAPGVLQDPSEAVDAETFGPAVEKALRAALTALVKMRQTEGTHLAKDLRARIATSRKAVAAVAKLSPKATERYREQLRERIKSIGLETPDINDERLVKEVVYFAERSDISEELTRLESHFLQFDESLATTEPVGRTLDFLVQEMNREVNTIGSKANDAAISRHVITLKSELEKLREQVQNVE